MGSWYRARNGGKKSVQRAIWMAIYDQDTDPSSPGARRPPGSRATSTDPGVGPPSQDGEGKPMGVVVPPAGGRIEGRPVSVFASPGRAKDSVELLLEGMAGPRPDRVKTMPRTSGEAAASYHAEHAVHAAHTSPDDQPKVMVERGSVEVRDATDPSQRGLPLVEVPDGWRAADPTYVPPRPLSLRIGVAALAGVLVVVGIFVSFGRTPQPAVVSAPEPVRAAPPIAAMAPEPVIDSIVQAPAAAPSSAPPPAPLPVAPATVAPQARAIKAKPRSSAQAPDMGEFKTTF
jgi:hypothetical protein